MYDKIQQLLKNGKIEEADTPFTSPLILVNKQDAPFRFFIDSIKINFVTSKENFIISHLKIYEPHLKKSIQFIRLRKCIPSRVD